MNSKLQKFTGLFVLMFTAFVSPVFANPILEPEQANIMFLSILIIIFFITLLIEYFISFLFIRKNLTSAISLLKSIFIINLITFPITQLLVIFLASIFLEDIIYFAELFPLIAEFFLLRWQLNKLYKKGTLLSQVSNKKILIINCTMNTITFVMGIILFDSLFLILVSMW